MSMLTRSIQYTKAKVQIQILIVLCFFVDKTLCQSDDRYYRDQSGWNGGSTAGERTAAWTQSDGVNVEELGDEFQGDMIVNKLSDLESPKPWPGKRIPYVITGQFTPSELKAIERAMNDIHLSTCLRFVPRSEENYYVSISSIAKGCLSHIGYNSTDFPMMNLQSPKCLEKKGTIIHELMHVAGITHEQSRYNRDNYVRVLWENIKPSKRRDFAVFQNDNYQGPYTFTSVMHYSNYAFSKNNQRTIVPNWQGFENAQTGQRDYMTSADSDKINALYQCPDEYFSDRYLPKLLGKSPPTPHIPEHPQRVSTITDAETGRILKTIVGPKLSMDEWYALFNTSNVAAMKYIGRETSYPSTAVQSGTTNSGYSDTRYYPSIAVQSGTANSGYSNTGYYPSTAVQSGTTNSGYSDTRYYPSIAVQSATANSGYSNTGYYPSTAVRSGTANSGYSHTGSYPSTAAQSGTTNSRYSNTRSYPSTAGQSGYTYSGIANTGYYPSNTGQTGYSYSSSAPKYNYGSGYYVQSK